MVYSNVPTKPEQVYRLTPEGLAFWSELTTPPAAKIEKRNACPHNSIEATYSSPLGRIILESDGEVLTGLRFVETVEAPQQAIETIPADTTDTLPIFAEVRQWLDDYFVGKRPCNVPRLNPPGTDFQRQVWQKLFSIFYGQTKTYGEIARMVGCKSAQAVGQAIGRNPIALIIPCHRVVGANGSLGGYAYGLDRKKQLLELEK